MKNFIIIILSITLLEFFCLSYYNNLITTQQNGGIDKATVVKNDEIKPKDYEGLTRISDSKLNLVAETEDGSYIAYTDAKNNISIRDIQSSKIVYAKKEDRKIIYIKWIRKDNLFIATEKIVNGSKEITIQTFNLSNKTERTIKTFTQISATSIIKTITFSEFTNDVYILIGNDKVTRIYHLDTNGNMSSVESQGKYMTDILVTATNNTLFMEEYNNEKYSVYKKENQAYDAQIVKTDARILNVVGDDLYLGVEDTNKQITDIYSYGDKTLEKIISLHEPVKKNAVYVSSKGEIWSVNSVSMFNESKGIKKPFPTTGTARIFGSTVVLEKINAEYILNLD